MIQAPPRLYPQDPTLSRVENNIINTIVGILKFPLLNSNLFEAIDLKASTPLEFHHQLKKQPSGWVLTDLNAFAKVRRNSWSKTIITLESDIDCTISILIY